MPPSPDVGGRDYEFFNGAGPLQGKTGDLYDGGIREPMIVHWPGHVLAGKTSDVPWYFADVLPTMTELGRGQVAGGDRRRECAADAAGARAARAAQRFMYWEYPAGRLPPSRAAG